MSSCSNFAAKLGQQAVRHPLATIPTIFATLSCQTFIRQTFPIQILRWDSNSFKHREGNSIFQLWSQSQYFTMRLQ